MTTLENKLRKWSQFLNEVRQFFLTRDFIEVSTPALVPVGAFESSLDCLRVSWSSGFGELNTSPEIAMKQILADTKLPIFQIAKCFRDDPKTPVHRIEFHMLEFYEPFANYEKTRKQTWELFTALSPLPLKFTELTVKEAFLNTTGIDIFKTDTLEGLRAEIKKKDLISFSEKDSWEDLYFKIMLEKVEPSFSHEPGHITFLKDYPPSQATLSALSPKKTFAQRFEAYSQGIELCNGCTELKDVAMLEERFVEESKKRQARGKDPHQFPEHLKQSMEKGPPASGVAVGLDRLFFVLHGFPLYEAESES